MTKKCFGVNHCWSNVRAQCKEADACKKEQIRRESTRLKKWEVII